MLSAPGDCLLFNETELMFRERSRKPSRFSEGKGRRKEVCAEELSKRDESSDKLMIFKMLGLDESPSSCDPADINSMVFPTGTY